MSDVIKSLEYQLESHQRPKSDLSVQQPGLFVPGLRQQPWWDTSEFQWVKTIEDVFPEIYREYRVLDKKHPNLWQEYTEPQVTPTFGLTAQPLHDAGNWDVIYLTLLNRRFDDVHQRCPVTSQVLEAIPAETMVKFSRLAPHSHIPAHCGPTNLFLRCHLGLDIPDSCGMRVDSEVRT